MAPLLCWKKPNVFKITISSLSFYHLKINSLNWFHSTFSYIVKLFWEVPSCSSIHEYWHIFLFWLFRIPAETVAKDYSKISTGRIVTYDQIGLILYNKTANILSVSKCILYINYYKSKEHVVTNLCWRSALMLLMCWYIDSQLLLNSIPAEMV